MTSAFLYLTISSLKNRFRTRLRRLRQPRYLIGSIVGLLYFGFLIFQPSGRRRRNGDAVGALGGLRRFRETVEVAGGSVLFVFVALSWVFGSSRAAMAFTPAEVQFLFTAPISRPALIRYKVLRTQLAATLGSAFMTVMFRPPTATSGVIFFLGVLLLSATLSLHFTGVSFRRQSLRQHGHVGLGRQAIPIGIVLTGVAIVFGTLVLHWTPLRALGDMNAVFAEIQRLGSTGAAGVVLWPFRKLISLPMAGTWPEFFQTLPFVLGLLVANYIWVIRSDAAFEEASAERGEELARMTRAPGSVLFKARGRGMTAAPGSGKTPFKLGLEGPTETALLWKNLILVGRFASLTVLLRLLPMVLFVGVMLSQAASSNGLAEALAVASLIVAVVAVVFGPYIARNDLRSDLAKIAILKSWPVRGGALVRGEILAPVVLLTAITWVSLAGAVALSSDSTFGDDLEPAVRLTLVAAAALATPGLIAAQLLVHNGMALMFPAWVRLGPRQSRGIDTTGQVMLMMLGMTVAVTIALIPAVLVGVSVGASMYAMSGTVPILIPVAAASAALLTECALGAELLGGIFDRMDISAIEAQEG